jgi:hypothetical protein
VCKAIGMDRQQVDHNIRVGATSESSGDFLPVSLPDFPVTGDRHPLIESVATWLSNEPFRALVTLYQGPPPIGPSPSATVLLSYLNDLESFSILWDFRNGKERNLSESVELAGDHEELVQSAARALGMVRSPDPSDGEYDFAIVLGGLVRGCILRPQLIGNLVNDGLRVNHITAVGAFRPLAGNEFDLATASGIGSVLTEFDAMDAGMRRSLNLSEVVEEQEHNDANPNASWLIRRYRYESEKTVDVVAAPSSDLTRRANTPDAYSFWGTKLCEAKVGSRVLLVTTAIYRPYHHVDAIRLLALPYGVSVETVGVDDRIVSPVALEKTFKASDYLQELRSMIRSLQMLVSSVSNK